MATLKILCLADGAPTPFDGQYLVEYDPSRGGVDPNGDPMTAHLVTTPEIGKALHLPTDKLIDLWRKPYGIRDDGKPNRPLTAFSVVIE